MMVSAALETPTHSTEPIKTGRRWRRGDNNDVERKQHQHGQLVRFRQFVNCDKSSNGNQQRKNLLKKLRGLRSRHNKVKGHKKGWMNDQRVGRSPRGILNTCRRSCTGRLNRGLAGSRTKVALRPTFYPFFSPAPPACTNDFTCGLGEGRQTQLNFRPPGTWD